MSQHDSLPERAFGRIVGSSSLGSEGGCMQMFETGLPERRRHRGGRRGKRK